MTMNNFSHKKKWNTGTLQMHVDRPPIPLIKIKKDDKSDKYLVNIKLRTDPMLEKSDPYELKMALIENVEPEEFLLFVSNLNMALKA